MTDEREQALAELIGSAELAAELARLWDAPVDGVPPAGSFDPEWEEPAGDG